VTPSLRIRRDEVCSGAVLPDCAKHRAVGSLSQASTKATARCDELDITAPREKTPPTAVLATPQDLSSAPCFNNHRSAHLKQKSSLSSLKGYRKKITVGMPLPDRHSPRQSPTRRCKVRALFSCGNPEFALENPSLWPPKLIGMSATGCGPQCNGDRDRALFAWMRG